MITFLVPVKTESLNVGFRVHRMAMVKKTKAQRTATRVAWIMAGSPRVQLPAVVTLVRIGPRALDGDNLQGSLKHVRDQVAEDVLQIDDRSPLVEWVYRQERPSRPKSYGVRVAVESARPATG